MRVQVTRNVVAPVRRGHPWIYREALVRPPKGLNAGAVVDLTDDEGRPIGWGLWDPASPIAVRVFDSERDGGRDRGGRARGSDAIAARVVRAIERRDGWFDETTTAFRLCNGEGDRAPGFVMDRYAETAVIKLDTDAWQPHLDATLRAITRPLADRGVRSIAIRAAEGGEGGRKIRTLIGPEPPDRVFVREHGTAMEVDLAHGQKTGAFLDQRENRARVRALAKGRRRALNLFSYAGGFSIAAALGGAQVTSVDVAAAAHASAQRTFRENGVDPSAHAFVSSDAFIFLESAKKRGDRFDLVISDPPSFAPSEKAKPKADAAYRKLHAAIAEVLADGAIFCASSCSSHVSMEDFVAMLDDATLAGRGLCVREMTGQPADHPTVPAWWEGRYLKFVVMS